MDGCFLIFAFKDERTLFLESAHKDVRFLIFAFKDERTLFLESAHKDVRFLIFAFMDECTNNVVGVAHPAHPAPA